MITFTRSDKHEKRVQTILEKYHDDLHQVELTVGVLLAHRDESQEPSVKDAGYPVEAVRKITSYRERVLGMEDLVFTLDATVFADLPGPAVDAWLDRLLTSVELVRDDEGEVRCDDAGRPKLKKRLCDWMLSGYELIAKRHGAAAPEARAFQDVYAEHRQTFFGWLREDEAAA